jgi:hypothetical protein
MVITDWMGSAVCGLAMRAPPFNLCRWKIASEDAITAGLAFNTQRGAMPLQYTLDDRKSKPHAAAGARTGLVDAIEAVGNARDVLRLNSDAMILHTKMRTFIITVLAQDYIAASRRVANGVAHEV